MSGYLFVPSVFGILLPYSSDLYIGHCVQHMSGSEIWEVPLYLDG